jgi:hypothetical protein
MLPEPAKSSETTAILLLISGCLDHPMSEYFSKLLTPWVKRGVSWLGEAGRTCWASLSELFETDGFSTTMAAFRRGTYVVPAARHDLTVSPKQFFAWQTKLPDH